MEKYPPLQAKVDKATRFFLGDRKQPDPGESVLDLGCRHGVFATAFAKKGFTVTGVDAREENLKWFRAWDDQGCAIIQADVKEFVKSGRTFDHIFCSGLLYHLDRPFQFLCDLAAITRNVMIDTHYAPWGESCRFDDRLSPLCENEGFSGRWFAEFPEGADESQREGWTQSSWSNHRSFWPLLAELDDMVREAGFTVEAFIPDSTPGFVRASIYARVRA